MLDSDKVWTVAVVLLGLISLLVLAHIGIQYLQIFYPNPNQPYIKIVIAGSGITTISILALCLSKILGMRKK